MSFLRQLQAATSLHDLAHLLNIKPASLSYTLYKIHPDAKYQSFEIAKRSGGTRTIDAPIKRLKIIQRALAKLLYSCQAEIELSRPLGPNKRPLKSLSHGFKKKHSIATNAFPHKRHRFVFNLDLENFFPTFNFGRVRGFFIKNRGYALNEKVATIIAQIACHKNTLPQGSPCSPVISNMIAHLLDVRLAQLAKRTGCTYTRYADDLTFSTNLKSFPSEIAYQNASQDSLWTISSDLFNAIERGGFKINNKKTRMHYRVSRQTVTGLTVNRKVNIRADYYRLARAMADRLFKTGAFEFIPPKRSTPKQKKYLLRKNSALKVFWYFIISLVFHKSKIQHQAKDSPKTELATVQKLEGIINHIHNIKNLSDDRKDKLKRNVPSPIRKIYRELLFFKYFVDLKKPLIIGEGKTDNIYLTTAIRRLANLYPQLIDTTVTKEKLKIQLFSRKTKQSQHILKLEPGSTGLKFLINDYKDLIKRYAYLPLAFPVIILIDNDKGADEVFAAVKNASGLSINETSTDLFYHIFHNLYLVKTPEKAGLSPSSAIEDLFDKSVLSLELDGKKLNRDNDHDTATEYGKVAFAEKVVLPNAQNIDFKSFHPLLDRILAVINHYTPPAPKILPAP